MDDDAFGGSLTEASLELTAWGGGIAFHDGMESEQVGKGEYEGYMECEAAEPDTNDTSLDGSHRVATSRVLREKERRLWMSVLYYYRCGHSADDYGASIRRV